MTASARWSWIPRAGAPKNRRQMITALAVRSTLSVASLLGILVLTAPIWTATPPHPVPRESRGDRRFGLSLEERRTIFSEIVRNEPRYRARSMANFPGHAFSVSDDRSWGEMHDARELARQRRLNLSQVYLVLDEGIRKRWPGPDGQPIEATVPPLDPRR